jgi:hypothetical protein
LKKHYWGLMLVVTILLIFQKTGLAAHWMYVQRLEGTRYGPCHEFVDAESVVKTGNRLNYWSLWLMEKPAGPEAFVKMLRQNEVDLTGAQQSRVLEFYQYNADDAEVRNNLKPGIWTSISPGVRRAIHYLREDKSGNLTKPEDLSVSRPRWHTSGITDNRYNLLFDIRLINSTTKRGTDGGVPPEFEITVKKVWTETGAIERCAELTQVQLTHHGCRNLSYTVTTYRFSADKRLRILLWQSDHDQNGVPLQFFIGNEWEKVAEGSVEAEIQKIGVSWFLRGLGRS